MCMWGCVLTCARSLYVQYVRMRTRGPHEKTALQRLPRLVWFRGVHVSRRDASCPLPRANVVPRRLFNAARVLCLVRVEPVDTDLNNVGTEQIHKCANEAVFHLYKVRFLFISVSLSSSLVVHVRTALLIIAVGAVVLSFLFVCLSGGEFRIHASNRSNRTIHNLLSCYLHVTGSLVRAFASLHDQKFRPMFGAKQIRRPSLHAATFTEHVRRLCVLCIAALLLFRFGLDCSNIMPGPPFAFSNSLALRFALLSFLFFTGLSACGYDFILIGAPALLYHFASSSQSLGFVVTYQMDMQSLG